MIDKIKITNPDCTDVNLEHLEKRLITVINNPEPTHIYHYKIYNEKKDSYLTVKKYKGRLTIVGSVRKFYFGASSTSDLNFVQLLECIKTVANELKVKVEILLQSKILEIEIGKNMKVGDVSGLISQLVRHPHIKNIVSRKHSKVFEGSQMHISFYDKMKELKSRGSYIDCEIDRSRNLLRYEVKVKKSSLFKTKFKQGVFLIDFLNNYNRAIRIWYTEYKKIKKASIPENGNPNIQNMKFKDLREFKKYLLVYSYNEFGLETIFSMIENINTQSPNKSRLRSSVMKDLKMLSNLNIGYDLKLYSKKLAQTYLNEFIIFSEFKRSGLYESYGNNII